MEGRKVRKYRSGFTRLILTNKMYNQGGGQRSTASGGLLLLLLVSR